MAAKGKASSTRARDAGGSPPISREKQAVLYDRAMKLFNARSFAKAKGLLETVAAGPGAEIAHAARMHANTCERRLADSPVELKTPEDRYNYAITLINARQLSEAEEHLLQALDGVSAADHIHYALALCYGLQGVLDKAGEHLGVAIAQEPRNRAAVRGDPDFEPLLKHPEISAVLQHETPASD